MAEAIISAAAKRVFGLIEEQGRHHINLIRGAEDKVHTLAVDLQNIRNVLDDAENRRFKDKRINYWLSRLEQTALEVEDVVDEWDYFLLKHQIEKGRSLSKQKVCSFIPSSSCLCFNKVAVRHNIGNKMLSVKAELDEILKERDQYGFVISQPTVDPSPEYWRVQSTSMIDLTKVRGRDVDRDLLVTKLMDSSGSQEEPGFHILSIVGTGGLGKTTLAQMVYNHSRVVECFELRIWICVSDPFDLVAIAKGILGSIQNGNSPNTNNLDILFKHVQDFISGKRYLIVLDDVWTEDFNKWEPLENSLRFGGAGSKILVTSRSERVVKMMGTRESEICRPRLLSDEDCWLLLCRMALSGRNEVEFEDIGKKIAKKCKGLPLAAKALGSLLRFKDSLEQWSSVLNSKIWQMEEAEVDLFPHLLLSYTELSPTLKHCFSYCAVFPKDRYINVRFLIKDWVALGYLGSDVGDLELKGRMYFDILAMRSLFQDFEKLDSNEIKLCKMHDIVHDFAQFVIRKGRVEATGTKMATTCRVCDPSQVSMVNDFLTLYSNKEPPPYLCDCLVRLRLLMFGNCKRIPKGIENLIHLRRLNLVGIIKLSLEELKHIFQLYHLQTLVLRDCGIEEVPKEIVNLVHLSFLDLSQNQVLKELPTEIGKLIRLKHLDLAKNKSLKELPESMCNLLNLRTVDNVDCDSLCRIPEKLFPMLREFPVGVGGVKLELLKKLKRLRGLVRLKIRLDDDRYLNEVVQDAQRTDLKNEVGIKTFEIDFKDEMKEEESSSFWKNVMDALEPHPTLHELIIWHYGGSKFPRWMVSPLNQLKNLHLYDCKHLTSLPPFGKLPCLEEIHLGEMKALEIVGREFLGITSGEGSGGDVIAFPKLKKLAFWLSDKWNVWEDITVEEAEESLVMPCLTHLTIRNCNGLTMLPHRLLHKVSSFKALDISGSKKLKQRYGDKDGSDWKSISMNNPALSLIMW